MRLWRKRGLDRDPEFDWREIACQNEGAAQVEAKRQQGSDDPDVAEWIYLRNASGQWVARRTPRNLRPRVPFRTALWEWALGWLNPFPGP
jgi:hypothetical protein